MTTLIEAQVSLLDALPTALLLADAGGRVLYANARAERILGPLRGERIGDVLAPEALIEEATAGEGAYGRRVRARRAGGRRTWSRRRSKSPWRAATCAACASTRPCARWSAFSTSTT